MTTMNTCRWGCPRSDECESKCWFQSNRQVRDHATRERRRDSARAWGRPHHYCVVTLDRDAA